MRQPDREKEATGYPRPAPEGAPALLVDNLRAYYLMHYFGVEREVRAIDDISLVVRRNEIYGIAGEFELRQDNVPEDNRRRRPAAAHRDRAARFATASSIATFTPSARRTCPRYAGSISPISPRAR